MSQHIEIIARGVLYDGDRLLLCRNQRHGHLFLPGGHVDFGEPAREALEREVREELGARLAIGRFRGATEASFEQPDKNGRLKRHHEINLVFELDWPADEAPRPADLVSREDHIAFVWTPIEQIAGGEPAVKILPPAMARLAAARPGQAEPTPPGFSPGSCPGWASDWQ